MHVLGTFFNFVHYNQKIEYWFLGYIKLLSIVPYKGVPYKGVAYKGVPYKGVPYKGVPYKMILSACWKKKGKIQNSITINIFSRRVSLVS